MKRANHYSILTKIEVILINRYNNQKRNSSRLAIMYMRVIIVRDRRLTYKNKTNKQVMIM